MTLTIYPTIIDRIKQGQKADPVLLREEDKVRPKKRLDFNS